MTIELLVEIHQAAHRTASRVMRGSTRAYGGLSADDIAQDAALWALENGGAETPAAFGAVAGRTRAISAMRTSRHRSDALAERARIACEAQPLDDRISDRRVIERLLALLPEKQSSALLLRAAGESSAEIAEQLGISTANADQRVCCARRRLRKLADPLR